MSGLSFGSFEKVLHSYITLEITKEKLVNILLTSPQVDARQDDKEKGLQRNAYGVEKSTITRICSGERGLPSKIRKYHSAPDALEYVKLCFSLDIVPHIQDSGRDAFLREVLALIQQDEGLPPETKAYFTKCAAEEELSDFLAEVYLYVAIGPKASAAQRGENILSPKPDDGAAKPTPPQTSPSPDDEERSPAGEASELDTPEETPPEPDVAPPQQQDPPESPRQAQPSNTDAPGETIDGSPTTIVQNHVKVVVVTPKSPTTGETKPPSTDTKDKTPPPPDDSILDAASHEATPKPRPKKQYRLALLVCAILAVVAVLFYFKIFYTSHPVEEIFVTEKEIVLAPGEKCPLKVAVLPIEAEGTPLSFVSSDTNIVTVSPTGVLEAHDNPQEQERQPVDITVQAESGATKIKTVMVDFSGESSNPPEANAEVEAGYYVWQKIRLVGTDEWADTIDAGIGDIVEIQIQYKNIGETTQENVMIRDVLPPNLVYVPETTQLYNVKYDGSKIDQDTVVTTGINIGNYTPGSNAYVRLSAKIIDVNLAPGSTKLVNWSQAGVGPVTLSDYVTVVVQK